MLSKLMVGVAAAATLMSGVALAQSSTVNGAAGGAVTGAIVGGPVGAAVGGVAGSVVNPPTGMELTTAWNVNAAYEHFWNPRWRTSLYGGYAQVRYGDTANGLLCGAFGGGNAALVAGAAVATAGCNNDWNTWWIGSRTQWNITKDFYMGLDVLYSKLEGASTFNGLTTGNVVPSAAIAPNVDGNQDNWSFRFRVHRDFYP